MLGLDLSLRTAADASLWNACGYRLANEGRNAFEIQHYLGHTSLDMTSKYCALAENRFRNW